MAVERLRGVWAVGFLALVLVATDPLAAQEAAGQAQSLKLVPADAATYNVILRAGEQLDAILKSKAWARLNQIPFIKMAWEKADEAWKDASGPLAAVRAWYERPGNPELIRLLKDLIADEVFVYGGRNTADFYIAMQNIFGAYQTASFSRMFQPRFVPGGHPLDQIKPMIKAIADSLEDFKLPDSVIGFRVRNPQAVQKQIKRFDDLVKMLSDEKPELNLNKYVSTKKIGGASFRVLTFTGEMIPWDKVPITDLEEQPGDLEPLVKKIKGMKLTIAFGVRDNWLLVGCGEGTGGVEALGKSRSLADVPEMKKLAKFADRKLAAITYTSKAYQGAVGGKRDLADMIGGIKDVLKNAGLPAEAQDRIKKDLKDFSRDMQRFVAEPGANMSVSFLNDRGQETITYDWTKSRELDATKPLTLLEHLGGDPLFAMVSRYRYDPEEYKILVKWVKKAYGYVEEFGLPNLPPGAREPVEQFLKRAQPMFARLDKATGEMLIPALADGQVAFLIDAKMKNKQWHFMLPPSEKELPFPELALVLGVSDVDLLKKGFAEYREAINGLIAAVAEVVPIPIGEVKLPEPEHKKVKGGDLYYYQFPILLGLDQRIAPTGGLSKSVAAFTLSKEHAERLMAKTQLKAKGGPFADVRRPLASATYFDWPATLDALSPWLEFGLREAGLGNDVIEQAQAAMDVLKVLRSYASVTYLEDGITVTRSETVVKDLER